MKRILIALVALAAMAAVSCAPKEKDPVKELILSELQRSNPELKSFSIYKIEKLESVKYGTEMDRRIRLFSTKIKAETKAYQSYLSQGLQNNASARLQQKEQAEAILEALNAMKAASDVKADSIIYSVYKFSGKGSLTDGSQIPECSMTINLSEDLTKSWNLVPEGSNKYKGMGAAIPGYLELLKSISGSGEEE